MEKNEEEKQPYGYFSGAVLMRAVAVALIMSKALGSHL